MTIIERGFQTTVEKAKDGSFSSKVRRFSGGGLVIFWSRQYAGKGSRANALRAAQRFIAKERAKDREAAKPSRRSCIQK